MKLHRHLFTAAVFGLSMLTAQAAPKDGSGKEPPIGTASSRPPQAAPKDWVGKELPALGVDYLEQAPELKGKPAVVEFWATWCPPCRTSIPHLNSLNKKFKDKGLVVVGISDEEKTKVEDFRKTTPMEYHVAIDKKNLAGKFGVQGIPHAFVVDKDGKITWQGHPMALTEAELEKVTK